MFCSEQCREKAFKMYHRYECFNSRIVKPEHSDLLNPMKTLFYGLYLFDHKIEDLKAFILSRGVERKIISDYDLNEWNSIETKRNLFLCVDSLVPNKRCAEKKPFHLMFKKHHLLKKMWKKEKKFLTLFLNRHYDISAMVHLDIWKWASDTAEVIELNQLADAKRKQVGYGCYVFTSMFNHSCVPNVELHCGNNGKMYLIVNQNIARGQQLFRSFT